MWRATSGGSVDSPPADLSRQGLHPTRGATTIGDMLERLVIDHLAEHTFQLRELLAAS
jgi:hypothetical protein